MLLIGRLKKISYYVVQFMDSKRVHMPSLWNSVIFSLHMASPMHKWSTFNAHSHIFKIYGSFSLNGYHSLDKNWWGWHLYNAYLHKHFMMRGLHTLYYFITIEFTYKTNKLEIDIMWPSSHSHCHVFFCSHLNEMFFIVITVWCLQGIQWTHSMIGWIMMRLCL